MTRARRSDFTEWFEAQFGKRPSGRALYELLEEAEAARKLYEYRMQLYRDVDAWELKRDAALKGSMLDRSKLK